MPSISIGFWVASTKNGLGSGRVASPGADGVLLHRFQQRGLGLGRGAVDLVGQHDVGEDGPGLEPQRPTAVEVFADDGRADDVGRHQVGRELDAVEAQRQHLAQGPHQQRLAQARHAFEQDVAAREQRHQHLAHRLVLADDDLAQLAFDLRRAPHEVGDIGAFDPGRAVTSATLSLALFQLLKVLFHEVPYRWRDVGAVDVVAAALGVLAQNVTIRPRRAAHRKWLVRQVLVGGPVAHAAGHEHVLGGLADGADLALEAEVAGAIPAPEPPPGGRVAESPPPPASMATGVRPAMDRWSGCPGRRRR